MRKPHNIFNQSPKQFPLLSLLIGLLSMMFSASVLADVSGEAFWGSFGEGAGRVECVVFKSEDGSHFIGYDEESETGFYSTSVAWDENAVFSFEGVTLKKDATVASSGRGLVSASLSASDIRPVLLEGSIEEETLNFKAFESGAASYHQFDLVGFERSTLKVVFGENGRAYALFTGANEIAYGGEVEFSENDNFGSFITPEGDEFSIDLDTLAGSFELAAGSTGELADVAYEVAESHDNWVEQIWLTEGKLAERGSSAVHFILEGEGRASLNIEALVSVIDASSNWLFSSNVTVGLYKMNNEGEYDKLFDSASFYRVKTSADTLLDLEGALSCQVSEGTYLVQVSGIYDARSVNDVTVRFDRASQDAGLRVVNMSTLYIAGQIEGERSFGFRLGGDSVSKAVIRNVGPSLQSSSLPSHSVDPKMAIAHNDVKTWKNDDWWKSSSPSQLSNTMMSLGAFELDEKSKDAAAKLTLRAGDYDVTPQGAQKDSAYELVEVYFDERG